MSINVDEQETLQMTIWRRAACWISKATYEQAYARARAPTHKHVRTHAHTHTQKYVIVFAFPRQQWLRESASMLCYT